MKRVSVLYHRLYGLKQHRVTISQVLQVSHREIELAAWQEISWSLNQGETEPSSCLELRVILQAHWSSFQWLLDQSPNLIAAYSQRSFSALEAELSSQDFGWWPDPPPSQNREPASRRIPLSASSAPNWRNLSAFKGLILLSQSHLKNLPSIGAILL